MDHLLDERTIDSETHETYSIANKTDLATMKLKLELAKLEREHQQAALLMKEREATLREREAALRKEEQEREAALREREAAMRKEEQEREMILFRERKRVQLEAKQRHLEIQREHDKQQAAMAIECRQQELTLENTYHTQRQHATASLPVSFNISHASKLMPPFVETEIDVFLPPLKP
ncbi:mitogen-activated protein kinase kinase kinase kinase 4-like [Procambarus clarkii]|uniref:mitogen-activated protein kinase kinase kinase kinase 4-like n=1 Tax=Procambarus clarkii TaxID=6728 RepID=UPI003742FCAE